MCACSQAPPADPRVLSDPCVCPESLRCSVFASLLHVLCRPGEHFKSLRVKRGLLVMIPTPALANTVLCQDQPHASCACSWRRTFQQHLSRKGSLCSQSHGTCRALFKSGISSPAAQQRPRNLARMPFLLSLPPLSRLSFSVTCKGQFSFFQRTLLR